MIPVELLLACRESVYLTPNFPVVCIKINLNRKSNKGAYLFKMILPLKLNVKTTNMSLVYNISSFIPLFWIYSVSVFFLSDEKPTVVQDGYLLCPAPRLHEVGQ